jgi:hypothetical protein
LRDCLLISHLANVHRGNDSDSLPRLWLTLADSWNGARLSNIAAS